MFRHDFLVKKVFLKTLNLKFYSNDRRSKTQGNFTLCFCQIDEDENYAFG